MFSPTPVSQLPPPRLPAPTPHLSAPTHCHPAPVLAVRPLIKLQGHGTLDSEVLLPAGIEPTTTENSFTLKTSVVQLKPP